MKIRMHIVFTGLVQGVGFRWRAGQAARLYGCTGWVRNEDDGSVTLELQAEEVLIDKVVQVLLHDRYIHVSGMESSLLPTDPEERAFRTDYGW